MRTRALPPHLLGAGLGLYGQRTTPIVDRDVERDALWDAFTEVWHEGEARFVLLQGPAGLGKSRLGEWISRRTHELGVSTPLRVIHEPIPGPTHGLEPALSRHWRCQGLDTANVLARLVRWLCNGGRIALTLYIAHIWLGMNIQRWIGWGGDDGPGINRVWVFSLGFMVASVVFANLWLRRFKRGPLEAVIRRHTG